MRIDPICVICGKIIKHKKFGKCPNWYHLFCIIKKKLGIKNANK